MALIGEMKTLTVNGKSYSIPDCEHTTTSGSGYRYDYYKYSNGLMILTLYWEGTTNHYTQALGGYGRTVGFSWDEAFVNPQYTVSHSWRVGSGFSEPAGIVIRSGTNLSLYAISNASGEQSTTITMVCMGRWK